MDTIFYLIFLFTIAGLVWGYALGYEPREYVNNFHCVINHPELRPYSHKPLLDVEPPKSVVPNISEVQPDEETKDLPPIPPMMASALKDIRRNSDKLEKLNSNLSNLVEKL